MDREITIESAYEAIVFDDVKTVTKILEVFELQNNGSRIEICMTAKHFVSVMLDFAAGSANRGTLTDEMAYTLINYASSVISFFKLARAIAYAGKIVVLGGHYMPYDLREAVNEGIYNERVEKKIEALDDQQFRDFLSYITMDDDVKSLTPEFCPPILRYVYRHKIVPRCLLFALMSSCLDDTIEERTGEFFMARANHEV